MLILVKFKYGTAIGYAIVTFGLTIGINVAYILLITTIPFLIPTFITDKIALTLVLFYIVASIITTRGLLNEYKLTKFILGSSELVMTFILFYVYTWGIYTFSLSSFLVLTISAYGLVVIIILIQVIFVISFLFEWLAVIEARKKEVKQLSTVKISKAKKE